MIVNWLALVVGFGSILLGNALEGGHIGSLIQPTAAMIVFGGTIGATMLAHTGSEFSQAIRSLGKVFLGKGPDYGATIKEIIEAAQAARKDGILALEKNVGNIKNEFFAKNLRHIIDGFDAAVLKDMMEESIHHLETDKAGVAKVYETAGGFSPTIGIIGAVMGLIHVMSNLSDSSKLGAGIAVAFVATIYGVASANLVFLPTATKLKKIFAAEMKETEIIYFGLLGIQNGVNPRTIEERLKNLAGEHGHEEGEKKAA